MLNLTIKEILRLNNISERDAYDIDGHLVAWEDKPLNKMLETSYGKEVLTCIVANLMNRKNDHPRAFVWLFPIFARAYLLSFEQELFFPGMTKAYLKSHPDKTQKDATLYTIKPFMSTLLSAWSEIDRNYDVIMKIPMNTSPEDKASYRVPKATAYGENIVFFSPEVKEAEKEKGRELTMGEMAEMGLIDDSPSTLHR